MISRLCIPMVCLSMLLISGCKPEAEAPETPTVETPEAPPEETPKDPTAEAPTSETPSTPDTPKPEEKPAEKPADKPEAAKPNTDKLSLDFKATPLKDVIAFLKDKTKLKISIDDASLEKLEIDASKIAITFNAKETSLKAGLNKMLEPHKLTHRKMKDGSILIIAAPVKMTD